MDWVIGKSVQMVVQEVFEQEVQDYLGRGYYERSVRVEKDIVTDTNQGGVKNAERGGKKVEIPMTVSQVQDNEETCRSAVSKKLRQLSLPLEQMAV